MISQENMGRSGSSCVPPRAPASSDGLLAGRLPLSVRLSIVKPTSLSRSMKPDAGHRYAPAPAMGPAKDPQPSPSEDPLPSIAGLAFGPSRSSHGSASSAIADVVELVPGPVRIVRDQHAFVVLLPGEAGRVVPCRGRRDHQGPRGPGWPPGQAAEVGRRPSWTESPRIFRQTH